MKFPLGDNKKFFTMEKSRIERFPINNDLATTGHKLQGMTKKFLLFHNQLQYTELGLCSFVKSYYIGWCIFYATIKTKFQSQTD